MTTRSTDLWNLKPSPLMIRILSAFVFIAVVIAGVFLGIVGVYALVVQLRGFALWECSAVSDQMGSCAPGWLLFPLGAFFAFSGTDLRQGGDALVDSLASVGA